MEVNGLTLEYNELYRQLHYILSKTVDTRSAPKAF